MIKTACSILVISFWLSSLFMLGGCSSDEDKSTQEHTDTDHVWKAQTQALDKAKGVEQIIQSSAEQHNQTIEEQSQ